MSAATGAQPLYQDELPSAGARSWTCRRGTALTLTDLAGGANVSALLYSAANPLERYCMPDTLKAQHVSRLTAGVALYSDMGRVLASIVEDGCGWHDTISGHATAETVASKWGANTYQQARNEWRRSAREAFLVELAKHGLGQRDLHPNINFFSKVEVEDEETGALSYVAGNSPAGSHVTLRFELDTLIVLWNGPHPLAEEWLARPVRVTLEHFPTAGADDAVRTSCEENERGFAVTEAALA